MLTVRGWWAGGEGGGLGGWKSAQDSATLIVQTGKVRRGRGESKKLAELRGRRRISLSADGWVYTRVTLCTREESEMLFGQYNPPEHRH